MQFVFQPLVWGFLLVLVPLLVHLINLLRHRKQKWAAMEFLLESYRKHKRWVWMKQLLLLLSRMAVMAILVAMLAQWVSSSRWLSIFGQTVTHHYVLLDDSLSMSDSIQGVSAYQNGLRAIANLVRSVANDQGSHQLTVLRYSRALLNNADQTTTDTQSNSTNVDASQSSTSADILSQTILSNSDSLLERLSATRVASIDANPIAALQIAQTLIRQSTGEESVVHLVSDFREKDWRQSQAIKAALEPIKAVGADIELIDCAAQTHENLGIVALKADQEILAAGVPVMLRVEVRNFGTNTAKNVNVTIRTYEYDLAKIEPHPELFSSGIPLELPPIVIDSIAPGETASQRVQVIFNKAGSHIAAASIPDDVMIGDNTHSVSLDVTEGQQILIVDGDSSQQSTFLLNATLNPGSLARTGWKTRNVDPSFLRDSDAVTLDTFAAIVLFHVRSLDPRAIDNLDGFVQRGGGAAIFLGGIDLNQSNIDQYNAQLYRDGKGLLPYKLSSIGDLPPPPESDNTPDIIPDQHPIFAPLLGLSNSPFQFVRISRYVKALESKSKESSSVDASSTEATSTANVFARLRNGEPLFIDSGRGLGRFVVSTIGLDPQSTNWPQDPTFVVTMLKLMGYLSSFRPTDTSSIVGTPIRWDYSSQDLLPEVDGWLANSDISSAIGSTGVSNRGGLRLPLALQAKTLKDLKLEIKVDSSTLQSTEEQQRAWVSTGVTELWGTSLKGPRVVKNFARNPPPLEGELTKIGSGELITNLQPIPVRYRLAESIASGSALAGLTNRQGLLLAMLILMLMLEQFLAWSASFHIMPTKTPIAVGSIAAK